MIVIPHCLAFYGSQTWIESVQSKICKLVLEKLFYLFVLLIKSYNLTTFWRWPGVFHLLPAKNNKLKEASQQFQSFQSAMLKFYLALARTTLGRFFPQKFSYNSLKVYNYKWSIHHRHSTPKKLAFCEFENFGSWRQH